MVERKVPEKREKEWGDERRETDEKYKATEEFLVQALRLPIQPTDRRNGIPQKCLIRKEKFYWILWNNTCI